MQPRSSSLLGCLLHSTSVSFVLTAYCLLLSAFYPLLLRRGGGLGEVAGLDDGDLRRVDVLTHRGVDLFGRERLDLGLEVGVPLERAPEEEVVVHAARQLVVLGAADLPRLQVAGLRGLDLFGGEPVAKHARDLLLERGL